MEESALQTALGIISSGNALAILALVAIIVVYLVIKYQRNNTAVVRDSENQALNKKVEDLQGKVTQLELEKQLLSKDVDYIKTEQLDIKQDIKDIKNTLSKMAVSLERIATQYGKDKV